MKIYNYQSLQKLIDKGFICYTLREGSLIDDVMLYKKGYKVLVLLEKYVSAYSSGYSVRQYNEHRIPKKYQEAFFEAKSMYYEEFEREEVKNSGITNNRRTKNS